jgi:hypothetical protein
MANRTFRLVISLVGIVFGIGTPSGNAGQIQTYILDVSGQSAFSTYQYPPAVLAFFGTNGGSLPANGLPAGGLPGVDRLTTATSGVLVDAGSTTGSGNSTFGNWSAFGSSAANSTYGRVGAEGSGTRINSGDANTVVGFEGFGLFKENFTFKNSSLNGSQGSVVFHFTVDGAISLAGSTHSNAGVAVNYQQNAGPISTLMGAILQTDSGPPDVVPRSGPGHDGFSITASSISGSGVFDTSPLNLIYGTPFDLTFGLLAYALPRDGSASSNFNSTALLTGIDVYDSQGNQVHGFSILSGSGTRYDANGVHFAAVPEPTTLVLLGTGAFCLLACRLLRGRKPGLPQPTL